MAGPRAPRSRGLRRRRDVGTFAPPPRPEPAPIERVIEEGLLIARSAVRMAVRNQLIVETLGEGLPFDRARLEDAARREYLELARQNADDAERYEQDRREHPPPRRLKSRVPGVGWIEESEQQRQRPVVQRALGMALASTAEDDAVVAEVVDEARVAAWDELAHEITRRLARMRPEDDPDYLTKRLDRIRDLVETDLTDLELRAAERRAMREALDER